MKKTINIFSFFFCSNFRVPGVTIATDIICGFPSETETDFEETMTLCEKYKFPSLFINQFFARPGTPAARMERIPGNVVKQRTKRLTDLFNSYEPYSDRVDRIQRVLVTEISHDKKHYVGHNKFYEQILLPMNENLMGKSVLVKIQSATKFSMFGEILDDELDWQQCSNQVEMDSFLGAACVQNTFDKNNSMATIKEGTTTTTTTLQTPQPDDNKIKTNFTNIMFYYLIIGIFLAIVYRFVLKLLQNNN